MLRLNTMHLSSFIEIFLFTLGIYLLIGVLFALVFVVKGVTKVDSGAEGTSWAFKLMIIPGSIAFWLLLLRKWLL